MLNLWCDACRTIVPAVAAFHRPADDRFPWLAYICPGEPHLWLCPRCQRHHPDLMPFLATGSAGRGQDRRGKLAGASFYIEAGPLIVVI